MAEGVFDQILDYVFPRKCVACRAWGDYLCEECTQKVTYVDHQRCPICRQKSLGGRVCIRHPRKYVLDQVYSICRYRSPVVELVNEFKYEPYVSDIWRTIAWLMKKRLFSAEVADWREFVITAVPLHRRREWERGFNQSKLIAQVLSDQTGLQCRFDLLVRQRNTTHQTQLNESDRRKNIRGAVWINPKIEKCSIPNRIIVVDDVYTTGATLRECGRVLKRDGRVSKVTGFTFARG